MLPVDDFGSVLFNVTALQNPQTFFRNVLMCEAATPCDHQRIHLILEMYPQFYRAAQRAMRGQDPDHTLQPTALVNETLVRLLPDCCRWQTPADPAQLRPLFFTYMNWVLDDHNRKRLADKRGGEMMRVPLDGVEPELPPCTSHSTNFDDVLADLKNHNPLYATVIELRFCQGKTQQEAADTLGISLRKLQEYQQRAINFLRRRYRDQP